MYGILLSLVVFAFATSITPGPNNLMLMASGANFGFRRTLPHMLGVGLGFGLMIFLLGIGLIRVFDLWPPLRLVLKGLSLVYMLWLAWKIAHAAPPGEGKAGGKPLNFGQAAAFQWVNPKAWAMAMTALTAYMPAPGVWGVLAVSAVFVAVNVPSIATWVLIGREVRRWLTDRRRLATFNWTMAALLVLSLWPLLSH